MDAINEILVEFEEQLKLRLKKPDKSEIQHFTKTIESYLNHEESATIAQKFCELIERRLREVDTPAERLAHLCLIDSVVKSLPSAPYAKLFSVGIAAAFVGAFAASDSAAVRQRMFELRRAWVGGVFPDSVMLELDLAIGRIDSGWPVLAASPASSLASAAAAAESERKAADRPHRDVDMRRSWSQYRTSHPWGCGGGSEDAGGVDLQQFNTAAPADASLDQQQAAILELLGRVQPESLDADARRQLLGCVRDLQRLSAPGSPGSRLADSLAVTLGTGTAAAGAEQIPTHVDSALDKLLGGLTSEPATAAPVSTPPKATPPAPMSTATRATMAQAALEAVPSHLQIGCDPRLLAPVRERFEASRDIQVDGEIRRLALDRVQPLLVDGGEARAVRFKFPAGAAVFLEWEGGSGPVRLRAGDFTKVLFGRRPFIVCLGGPFHELVIHGKPFNVPFNEPKLVPIRAGFLRGVYQVRLQAVLLPSGVPVTPALDICPPIPRQWLHWASVGAFGAVNLLHKPPLNPLRLSSGSHHPHHHHHPPLRSQTHPPGGAAALKRQHPASGSRQPDVFKVFEHLVKMGLIGAGRDRQPAAAAEAPGDASRGGPRGLDRKVAKRLKREAATSGGSGCSSDSGEGDGEAVFDYDSDVDLPVDLTDFVEEKLERRIPAVVYRLDGGFQCPQCTLRFTRGHQSASFRRHMDEHYLRRVTMRANPPARCRAWYAHWSQLIKAGADDFAAAAADDDGGGEAASAVQAMSEASSLEAAAAVAAASATVCRVPARANPELNACGVCYEPFDTKWDDDTEDWLLQDCVELAGGGIYHPVCAEDAGKSAADVAAVEGDVEAAAVEGDVEAAAVKGDVEAAAAVGESPAPSSSSAAAALLSILRGAAGLQ